MQNSATNGAPSPAIGSAIPRSAHPMPARHRRWSRPNASPPTPPRAGVAGRPRRPRRTLEARAAASTSAAVSSSAVASMGPTQPAGTDTQTPKTGVLHNRRGHGQITMFAGVSGPGAGRAGGGAEAPRSRGWDWPPRSEERAERVVGKGGLGAADGPAPAPGHRVSRFAPLAPQPPVLEAPQPAPNASSPAARIASTGAGTPVNLSNCRAAWCTSRSRPLIRSRSSADAARGVGQGS